MSAAASAPAPAAGLGCSFQHAAPHDGEGCSRGEAPAAPLSAFTLGSRTASMLGALVCLLGGRLMRRGGLRGSFLGEC